MKVATEFLIEPMRLEHVAAVSAIERLSFSQPWPQNAYRRELQENRMAHYVVVRHLGARLDAEPDDSPLDASLPEGLGDGLFDRIARFLKAPQRGATLSEEAQQELRTIVGYAGLWLMTDEGHVTTIASHPAYRGRGVGELLLLGLIERALEMDARWLTLEVRASNLVAQNLYRKYTFKEMGVRKRYYSDDGEDALVMWTEALDSPAFLNAFESSQRRLAQRLGAEIQVGRRRRVLGDDDAGR